jgi:hypothetical protein
MSATTHACVSNAGRSVREDPAVSETVPVQRPMWDEQ